jgi:hypothetical protein
MSYKTGIDRAQNNILPDNLDAFIAEDNLVRVIDAFVDYLDLEIRICPYDRSSIRSLYVPT